jgi:hypothetical protein
MRKIKQNIWGNWNGYEGRRRVQQFGTDEISAAYWSLTGEVDFNAGYASEWFEQCKQVIKNCK